MNTILMFDNMTKTNFSTDDKRSLFRPPMIYKISLFPSIVTTFEWFSRGILNGGSDVMVPSNKSMA